MALVITQEKDDGGKDGPFLSFATKYKCELRMI